MNSINGEELSLSPQETATIIQEKYGKNAYDFLHTAVHKPTEYAVKTGQNTKITHLAKQPSI